MKELSTLLVFFAQTDDSPFAKYSLKNKSRTFVAVAVLAMSVDPRCEKYYLYNEKFTQKKSECKILIEYN
jgi:hypothetical protein